MAACTSKLYWLKRSIPAGVGSPTPPAADPSRPVEPGIPAAIVVEIEQHVSSKVLGLLERTRRSGCQGGTANRLQALTEKALCIARRHRLRAIANGEVDALAIEIEYPVVGGDEYVDIRMPFPKPRQPRQQPQCGKRDRGGDRQRRCRLLAADLGHRTGKLIEHRLRRHLQHLARLGQSKRAMPALEQGRAKLLLEYLHLPRQRRLGEKQLITGAGEA